MKIEVFRTGSHTDGSGTQRNWTPAELQKIVADYNAGDHEAPVVIGHPVDNAPAYGWVKSLSLDGDVMMAELHDVQPEFQDWVNRKLFKKRSISLYPNGLLRHVGFLGAQPPAVKGLKDFEFKEGDPFDQYEYEDKTTEVSMDPEELKRKLEEMMQQIASLTKTVGDLTAARDTEKARADKAEEELNKTAAEFADAKSKQTKAELTQFCDQLVAARKLLPKNKAGVLLFAEGLATGATVINFSDGKKESPLDAFKQLMNGLPQLTDLTLDFSDANPGKTEQTETIKSGQV